MSNWDYGGAWRRHDMSGEIHLPNNSVVAAHDLTQGLPAFMRQADTVFVDPPCSQGNLRSFHTKHGQDLPYSFAEFKRALFERMDEIEPRTLFVEVFKSNMAIFLEAVQARYPFVEIYDSFYYNRPGNRCWIIHASRAQDPELPIHDMDETKAIKWICSNLDYDCIGDPCIGRGTVGWHAYKAGKSFVGTELNPKRLAILVDKIRSVEND